MHRYANDQTMPVEIADVLTDLCVGCKHPGCGQALPAATVAGPGLKKCTRCLQVAYCSKNCQKVAWKEHKKHCVAAKTAMFKPVATDRLAEEYRLNNGQCFRLDQKVFRFDGDGAPLFAGDNLFGKYTTLKTFANSAEGDCAQELIALWWNGGQTGIKFRQHDVNTMKLGHMELTFKEMARNSAEKSIIRISNVPGVDMDECRYLDAKQIEAVAEWHWELVLHVRNVLQFCSNKAQPGKPSEAYSFLKSCIDALPRGSRVVFNLWGEYKMACRGHRHVEFLNEERFTEFKGADDVWFWLGSTAAPAVLDCDEDDAWDDLEVEDKHMQEARRKYVQACGTKDAKKRGDLLSKFRFVRGFGRPLLGSTKFLQQRFSFRVMWHIIRRQDIWLFDHNVEVVLVFLAVRKCWSDDCLRLLWQQIKTLSPGPCGSFLR